MNKIIEIEGTDCSGKKTQSDLLKEKLKNIGYSIYEYSFPTKDSATGDIIYTAYLGKTNVQNPGTGWFSEGASNVNPKVAGLFYAADRLYNLPKIQDALNDNVVILDRYVDSNLAHQGSKIKDKQDRIKMYEFFEKLEYEMLDLPRADIRVLLYMPRKYAKTLKLNRCGEAIDEHEKDEDYLKQSEIAYLEVAKRNNYKIIKCFKNGKIRSIEDINKELLKFVLIQLKK